MSNSMKTTGVARGMSRSCIAFLLFTCCALATQNLSAQQQGRTSVCPDRRPDLSISGPVVIVCLSSGPLEPELPPGLARHVTVGYFGLISLPWSDA
jgi:hypothetical protein